jgi:Tol biopolymer transport system component
MPNDTRDDIRNLLLEAASDLPVLAPAPDRTVRRARHRVIRTVCLFALAGGLVLGGLIDLANPFSRSMPAKAPHMKHGTWVVNTDTGASVQLEGLPRSAFWFDASRDGSTVAFEGNARGRSQIYLMDAEGSGLRQVTHEDLEASRPAMSRDGSMVAYRAFDRKSVRNISVMTLTTGRVERITHERRDVTAMAWSPDGSRIVYSVSIPGVGVGPTQNRASSSVLKVVDVRTHAVYRVAGNHRSPADFGTWSPDGSRIAYMTGHEWPNESYGFDPAAIWVVNEDGSDPEQILSLAGRGLSLKWSPTGSEIAFTSPEGDGYSTYAVDVNTHEVRRVAPGYLPTWLSDHAMIVHVGG